MSRSCCSRFRFPCRRFSAIPTRSASSRSQDLGDVTLQAHLGRRVPPSTRRCTGEAVALIERLQRRGAELASERYLPYRIAFDVEKLTWELDFFATHFVEGYRGVALTPAERDRARRGVARRSSDELAGEPRVLCHRDYHSRNLMLHDGSLHIIDFQDARMGPDTYDLVSLLRDSYVDLTDAQLDELIAYFLALKRADAAARRARRVPAAVRSDGAPAQPEGARHLRLSDDRPAAIRSTSNTCRERCATPRRTSQYTRVRPSA